MKKRLRQLFHSYNGRHFASRWVRSIVEKASLLHMIGLPLASASFFASVFLPQIQVFRSRIVTDFAVSQTPIDQAIKTESTFTSPLARHTISQRFSYFHRGVDFPAPKNTAVYAIEDGVIEEAGFSTKGYGNYVLINHKSGLKSLYAHLSTILVEKDQIVSRGEGIGRVGSTGWSTGYHLHLEIYYNGIAINPLETFPKT